MNRFLPLLCCFVIINFGACKKNNDDKSHVGKDIELTAQEQQKVGTDNQFSLKLFRTSATGISNNQNLFMSPLSVSMAFGMLANGSNGQTQTDIYKTMNFDGFDEGTINTFYNKLTTGLPAIDPDASISIANFIWNKKGLTILPQFLQTNTTFYKAGVQSLDFKSPLAVQTINNWVNDNTKGKIPKIINVIPDNIVMYLINAIYFKDEWDQQFDKAKSHQQAFYLANASTIQSNFMQGEVNIKTSIDDLGSMIELPYKDNKFSMVIMQPRNSHTFTDLVAGLDTTRWNALIHNLHNNRAKLIMPKFKFSYEDLLNAKLVNMGMSLAFSDNADFSRIDGKRDLLISEVKHKAFVEVSEEGTEAAAVTSIGIGTTSAPQVVNLTLDHPFIFMIREVKTGLILFTGIMNNPNDTGS